MEPWTPKQTANGFFPKFNPSGTHVVYGFCECHVCDLRTLEEVQILAPDPSWGRLANIGWLDDDTLIAATIDSHQAIYRFSFSEVLQFARMADLNGDGVAETRITLLSEAHNLHVPWPIYSFGGAGHGHWATSIVGTDVPSLIVKDGQPFIPDVPLSHGYLYGAQIAGDHLLTSNHEDLILHYVDTRLERSFSSAHVGGYINEHGDVGLGYYGPSFIAPWGQPAQEVTLTPWRYESAPFPIRVNGDLWLWSASSGPNDSVPIVFGRRLGETVPILIEGFNAAGITVAWTGTEFVLAGASDKGRLEVRSAQLDTPRQPIVDVMPEPEPEPEMPLVKPEITVEEYSPIGDPGGVFVFIDRSNPELALRIKIRNDNGFIYAEITHEGGHGETGKLRPARGEEPVPEPEPEPEPIPEPEPTPEPTIMLSHYIDPAKGLVAVKAVKPVANRPGVYTLILPNDRVYSMQPDGSDGDRDPGAEGSWECCRISGNVATFLSVGTYYTRSFVLVEGLVD